LTPDEQTLFRRLAVFTGGCNAEAVAAVAEENLLTVLDGLQALVDQSLLQRVDGLAAQTRWAMLETVREFALERLVASGEEATARQAHANHFLSLAEESWRQVVLQSESGGFDRIERDLENLRESLVWLEQSGNAEKLLRLAGALYGFWHFCSHRKEGRLWLARALALAEGAEVSRSARVVALHGAASLARSGGDYARATLLGGDCLALARDLGDRTFAVLALQLLSHVRLAQGDYAEAVAPTEEALALAEALGHSAWVAAGQSDLGIAALGAGDAERAADCLEPALACHEELGDRFNAAVTLGYLGLAACESGDLDGAATRFAAALPLWQEIGSRDNLAEWLAGVATFAVRTGRPISAARLFGKAAALSDELGHVMGLPERAIFERAENAARAVPGERAYAAASIAGRAVPLAAALGEATAVLAAPTGEDHALASTAAPPAPDPRPAIPANSIDLSPREQEVLGLLALRYSNPEIAGALFISVRTVEAHVANIFNKLGVNSRREAAAVAARRGLI
jgi:non-specific serine/threonine protein kinase